MLCKSNYSKFHTSYLRVIDGEMPDLGGNILQNGILRKIN
jgi:hypothetical protein